MQHAATARTTRRAGLCRQIAIESEELFMKIGMRQQRLVQGPPSFLPKSWEMAKIGRNEPCPCGSGKKYKQCCLATDQAGERTAIAAAQAADHLPHHHPRLCKDCNDKIDAAANTVIALIDAGKLDDAEHAAHALVERWPEVHDGYDCLGMVCQARGDNPQAAEYYQLVVAFARNEPSLFDPEFEDYYRDLIHRLDPMAARMGALPPHPRDT